ncbi:MAG TPA: glycoside hydrolase family 3 C-terminal domain-containing protein, partial [Acidobacteriaceae bacterium]|nr:glycoside hydrolase family 3 C-terminal domain-containing protein [Acidobacteriaceae bacterium]
KTVLVLMSAGPLAVTWAQDHLPAILSAWYPGETGGTAIARALFGLDNPGGHLPYTVYAGLDNVPPQNDYAVNDGFTYQYFRGLPLYPFGFGLSYTRFAYSHLQITPAASAVDGEMDVSFELQNTGQRAGADVAQLYTHMEKSRAYQPIRSLRAFQRVELQPGETKTVHLHIPIQQLAWYDTGRHAFVVEPEVYDLQVGSSSDDIRLRGKITVGSMSALHHER